MMPRISAGFTFCSLLVAILLFAGGRGASAEQDGGMPTAAPDATRAPTARATNIPPVNDTLEAPAVLDLPATDTCWSNLLQRSQWKPDDLPENDEESINLVIGCGPSLMDAAKCCPFVMSLGAEGASRGCFCVESFYQGLGEVIMTVISGSFTEAYADFSPYVWIDDICPGLGYELPILGNNLCPSGSEIDCEAPTVNSEEASALLDLHRGMEKLKSWSPDVNVCCWEGVGCDSTGHINSVDIESVTELSGTLPSSLSSLRHLTSLSLPDSQLSGPLPPSWSVLTNLQLLSMPRNALTGTLPPEYSELQSIQTLSLTDNQIQGPLPASYSTMTNPGLQVQLGFNRLTGPLPDSWSTLQAAILDLDSNLLTGTLPDSWGGLSLLVILKLSNNAGLTGSLPAAWSTMKTLNHMSVSSGRIKGQLPPQWSCLQNMEYLWLGDQSLTGPLPAEWSAFTRLHRLHLAHNFLTGTLPPEWEVMPLASLYAQDNWLSGSVPDWDRNGGPSDTATRVVDLQLNLFDEAPDGDANAFYHYNCLLKSQHRVCPHPWWPIASLVLLVLSPLAASMTAASLRGWKMTARDIRFVLARRRILVINQHTLLLLAVVLSIAQKTFVMSPAFTHHLMPLAVAAMRDQAGALAGEIFRLLARNLACLLMLGPLVAVVVAFLLRVLVSLAPQMRWLAGSAASRSWTLLASEDVLRDNLRVLRLDQRLLLVIFGLGSVLLASVVYAGLPETVQLQNVSLGAIINASNSSEIHRVPRVELALLCALYCYAFYSMVVTVMLPVGIICPSAAMKAVKYASKSEHSASSNLRTLKWLRRAPAMAICCVAIFLLAAGLCQRTLLANTSGSVMATRLPAVLGALLGCQVLVVALWNWAAWGGQRIRWRCSRIVPGGDTLRPAMECLDSAAPMSEGSIKGPTSTSPHCVSQNGGEDPETALISTREAGSRGRKEPQPTVNNWSSWSLHSNFGPGQRTRSWWQKFLQPRVGVVGRSRARSSALLVVIALQMVHIEAAVPGRILIAVSLFATAVILSWVAVVRDHPAGFDDICGSEAFGLVVLASDLANALEADLAKKEDEVVKQAGAEDPDALEANNATLGCCSASPGGCRKCQLIMRRFPATLFRMEETMCVSYRWQDRVRAVVRPEAHGPWASSSGVRDGIVGINMSKWQRTQLLAAIRRSSCTYVWLDVLSIPAALQPETGTRLWEASEKLMTRMMAVYAAAASTLVMLSEEAEGGRYCQRAWTMQEYCGARSLEMVTESSSAATASVLMNKSSFASRFASRFFDLDTQQKVSYQKEEAHRYSETRRYVGSSQADTVPLWVMAIRGPEAVHDFIPDVSLRANMFASLMGKVNCREPVDLVRALAPMLLNTTVQDMSELRTLVRIASSSTEPGSPGAKAMRQAERLLDRTSQSARLLDGSYVNSWTGSRFDMICDDA